MSVQGVIPFLRRSKAIKNKYIVSVVHRALTFGEEEWGGGRRETEMFMEVSVMFCFLIWVAAHGVVYFVKIPRAVRT